MRLSLPLISAIAATVVPAAQARANPAVRHDILLPTRDSAPARHNPDLNRAVSRGGLVTVVRATASLGPNLNRQTITLHASYTETVTTYIERTPVTIPAEEPSPPKDRNTTTYLPSATVTPQVQPTSVKAMDELDRFKPVTANLDGLPACLARCFISEQAKAFHDPNIQVLEAFCQDWTATQTWIKYHLNPCSRINCPGKEQPSWLKEKCPGGFAG